MTSMRLTAIKPGDIVQCNKKGRLFYAKVVGAGVVGTLRVQPLERNISYRHVTANEIVDHWSHNIATRRADRRPPNQTRLDLDDAR
jgi:hypothetical protein